jgi:hypothetical protein
MKQVIRSALLVLPLLTGCGGGTPPPNDGSDGTVNGPSSSSSNGEGMSASGTIGGLDRDAVQAAVNKAVPKVGRCIEEGRSRLRYLGGAFEIHVDVNSNGQATSAYLLSSTLGDQQAEACILDAFRSTQWPRPVGGEVGQLTQSLDYAAGGVDVPLSWSADELSDKMAAESEGEGAFADLKAQLDGCRKDAGADALSVTMYLDEDGLVQAVGMASGDDKRERALRCVEAIVKTTSFPAPGGSYAKVTLMVK